MPIYRSTISALWRGQTIQNVLHFDDHGNFTPFTVANDIIVNWIGNVRILQVNELVYTSVKVENTSSPGAPFVQQIAIAGTQGASPRIYTFTAFVLQLRTAVAGRIGRGRCFIAGHVEGAFVNGIIEIGQKNTWNNTIIPALANAYLSGSSNKLTLGITNKIEPAVAFKGVTSIEVRSLCGIQRRRNLGTGI